MIYVAATGFVDIFAYLFTVAILKFVGRKVSSFALFAFSGLCLLSLLAVPQGNTELKNLTDQWADYLNFLTNLRCRCFIMDSDASDVRSVRHHGCVLSCNVAYSRTLSDQSTKLSVGNFIDHRTYRIDSSPVCRRFFGNIFLTILQSNWWSNYIFQGKFAWYIPTTICGTTALIAGILSSTLPETKQKTLDDKN